MTRSDKDDADKSWSHTYGDVSCSFQSADNKQVADDSRRSTCITETDVGDACPAIQTEESREYSKCICIQETDIRQAIEIGQNYTCLTTMDSDATNNHQKVGNDTVTSAGINNTKFNTSQSSDNDMTDTCQRTDYGDTESCQTVPEEWICTSKVTDDAEAFTHHTPANGDSDLTLSTYYGESASKTLIGIGENEYPVIVVKTEPDDATIDAEADTANSGLDMQYEAPEIKHEPEDVHQSYTESYTADVSERILMAHLHTELTLSSPEERSGMMSGGGHIKRAHKRRGVANKSSSCNTIHSSDLKSSNQPNTSNSAGLSDVVKKTRKGKAAVLSNDDKKNGKNKGVVVSGVAKKKLKRETAVVPRVAKIKDTSETLIVSEVDMKTDNGRDVTVVEVDMEAGKGNDVAVSENASEYPCQKCGKSYLKSGNLKRHVCIRTKDLHCKCPVCGNIVGNQNTLKKHMLGHDGKRDHICIICQKAFMRKGGLKEHMRIHDGNEQYSCSECDKKFVRKSSLRAHSVCHSGVRSHQCDKCGATFGRKDILKKHVFHVHDGTKNIVCEFCEKTFSTKAVMERHMRIHTGERPYVCPYCGKAFTQPYQLTVHSRIHTQERPYQCADCGKAFNCNSQMKIHARIHSRKLSKKN